MRALTVTAKKKLIDRGPATLADVVATLGGIEKITQDAAGSVLGDTEQAKRSLHVLMKSKAVLRLPDELKRLLAEIDNKLTSIIVAQEFQDLSGQALKKTIASIQRIEEGIENMLGFTSSAERVAAVIERMPPKKRKRHNLAQSEVDALFS
jgi:hypothetical protein